MHRWRWVWDPPHELSIVVNHSMWSEIPWSRSGRQVVGQLRGEYPYFKYPTPWRCILSRFTWQVDTYLNVFQVAYSGKQRCCPAEHLLRNTPIWIWLSMSQSVRIGCSLINSWKALEYDVGERGNFKKNPTITQDLSRWCIATRGESVSTYPRRPKAEAFQ